MFARAVLKEGTRPKAILIPQQGVSRNQKGDPYAWVVDEAGTVAMRMLVIDQAIGNQWLVSSGLAAGDRIILEGTQRLRPGATVKPVPLDGDSGAPSAAKSPTPAATSN
jgi:membrane fusion protein (multidrug efflux system)